MPMRGAGPAALLLTVIVCAPAHAAKPDRLAEARQAYNIGNYDAAIAAATAAATEAVTEPASAAEARLVLGRALVERFRGSALVEDLSAARTALLEAGTAPLSPALRVEWLIGSAETLFFEEQYGASAAILVSILDDPRAPLAVPGGRDRLLDWWATATDRAARMRDLAPRREVYASLSTRLATELERDPSLGSAAYWQVVAARGQGDLDRAWDAAQAAWVRAPLSIDYGAQLRADLDRIVSQALIPDCARRAGREQEKQASQASQLREQWEAFKERWTPK